MATVCALPSVVRGSPQSMQISLAGATSCCAPALNGKLYGRLSIVDAATGQLSVASGAALDFEADTSVALSVRVTESAAEGLGKHIQPENF